MRKPYYRKDRGAWFVKTANGRSQIRLADTEEAAWEVWKEMQAVARPDLPTAPVAVIAENFLRRAKREVSSTTYDGYSRSLAEFCNDLGAMRARDLRPHMVSDWLDKHQSWGTASRRAAIIVLKRCFNWAVDEGLLASNPIKKLKRIRGNRREVLIADTQHAAMMQEADGGRKSIRRRSPFRQFLIALRHSGARPGTIAKVTAADVTPMGDAWVIQKHKTRGSTGKPLVIYLSPCLKTLTRILVAIRPTGPLFLDSRGKPWNRNSIRLRLKRLREKLELPEGTVAYAYRHTWTTRAMMNGTGAAEVAALLGHQDLKMIMDHYGHLDQQNDHLRQAAAKAVRRTG